MGTKVTLEDLDQPTASTVQDVLKGITLAPWYRECAWKVQALDPGHAYMPEARTYIVGTGPVARFRIEYLEPDTETGIVERQHARWWYVEPHMTRDDIIKTAWLALTVSDEHRRREGFQVDGVRIFNPHNPLPFSLASAEFDQGVNSK